MIITAVITGILIIILITVGGSIISNTLYGDTIKVPDFVGMTYEKASLRLKERD